MTNVQKICDVGPPPSPRSPTITNYRLKFFRHFFSVDSRQSDSSFIGKRIIDPRP
jgi:hypothetical protein